MRMDTETEEERVELLVAKLLVATNDKVDPVDRPALLTFLLTLLVVPQALDMRNSGR